MATHDYKYLVIFEKAKGNFSAYSPDLPGCIATGKTLKQTEKNMTEALGMHLQGLLEDGLPIPKPESVAEYLSIPKRKIRAS